MIGTIDSIRLAASVFSHPFRAVYMVCEHVSKGEGDSEFAVCAVHERYLPLLLHDGWHAP
jgi:hypothetical protein